MEGVEVLSCMVLCCCFLSSGQSSSDYNATVTACACSVESMWMASYLSSVVNQHSIADDVASFSSGMEGVCASYTEGRCTALITSVFCTVVLVFSVCVLLILMLEVYDEVDNMVSFFLWGVKVIKV